MSQSAGSLGGGDVDRSYGNALSLTLSLLSSPSTYQKNRVNSTNTVPVRTAKCALPKFTLMFLLNETAIETTASR